MIRSLRFRLTLWYLAFFSILFVLFSVFLYNVLSRSLTARLDDTILSEATTAAFLFQDELAETNGDLLKSAAEATGDLQVRDRTIAIFSDGRPLASTTPLPSGPLDQILARAAASTNQATVTAVPALGPRGSRVAVHRVVIEGHVYLAVVAGALDGILADLLAVRRAIFIGLPVLLALAGIGGYLLATRTLTPLGWMAAQTRQITESSLDTRLDIGIAAEELRGLAESFNELLGRLDRSFETMRRFVADASHELRTPLAVIRGEADVALSQDRSPAEYQESLNIILDEARRLSRLVDDLLNLARADSGHVRLQVREFYFNDLLAECCRSLNGLAAARRIDLTFQCAGDLPFRGDEELLRRLVLNLLDNAIRYTPPGGQVNAALDTEPSGVRLRVSDNGIGIGPEAAPHVFERFYRSDQSRTRSGGGFGLGLSIVKWIAESHHGAVQLDSRPSAGSTFTVTLPR
jgi:two-component system OmpR family sensor kinase